MRKLRRALALILGLALLCGAAAEAALPDGTYVPDGFRFSGGSGRVTIACPEVTVEGGAATAKLVFSSPNYTRAVVDGAAYAAERDGETSAFRVPAPLNADFTVVATTEAMSTPHDIEYTCHIYLGEAPPAEADEAGAPADTAAAAGFGSRDIPALAWEKSMPLRYAREFRVDDYAGGYRLLRVSDGGRYLVVPEGGEIPAGLDGDVRVIRRPVRNIYLAATSAMALFDALGALDAVGLSSLRQEAWTVEGAAAAMARGDMAFAGKYSAPDYELLVDSGCPLAIESTMILHAPKVREMIERLGIPVLVERSAYERHPLGRTEWIKLYGALLGREAEAEACFDRQAAAVEALAGFTNTEKTVAFFYIGAGGGVVVRGADDYVPRMIGLAGGRYIFGADDLPGGASVSVTMEAFYAAAADADFLVYNGAIDDPPDGVDALLAKNPLLADFRAVREGNVFTTDRALYQASDSVGELILDLHRMLTGEASGMRFLRKLS